MIKNLKFALVRDTKLPNRAHSTDAGIDIYVPNDEPKHILNKGESILINTGVKFEVPKGYMLTAFNKSGVASKKGLLVGACVIDSMYNGIYYVNLHKVTGEQITINPGDKIIQLILVPISNCGLEQVKEDELYGGKKTERSDGGFGSTDKK